MKSRSYRQQRGVISSSTMMATVVIILCACSPAVFAQWTQPDANGHINNTNSGNVGVGTSAPSAKLTVSSNTQAAPAAQPGTTVQIVGANGATARLVVDSFGLVASSIDLRKANNTALSPTAVGNNEILGQITWQGRGATSYNAASRAKIMVSAAENYTDTAQGAFMTFSVAPIGGITSVEAMRIHASGFIGIGTTAPSFRLDVQSGSINASGGLCIAGDCKTSWSQVGGSQWTTSGTTINYSTGNVGIGVASPTTKLDVNGTVNATALTVNGTAVTSSQWASNGSTINFGSGNVGINTSSPSGKLHVSGVSSLGTAVFGGTTNASHFNYNGDSSEDTYIRGGKTTSRVVINDSASGVVLLAQGGGNVGIGTGSPTAKLHVAGTGRFTGDLTVDGNLAAKYQDLAEWVPAAEQLAAGTVVVLDSSKSNQVASSTKSYDTRVAGVISAQPGIMLGEKGDGKVLVATTGRVLVNVDATNDPIDIGDLLVTSDRGGVAMKSQPVDIGGVRIHRPGTLIGKALEPLARGTGKILVLLSLQ
jgi:hypothetical protein